MSLSDDLISAFEPWLTVEHESFEVLERVNLASNPKAGGVTTAGWTNVGLPTFNAVMLGQGGAPAPTQEMADLGIDAGFHAIANTTNDRAYIVVPVLEGFTYHFSLYIWLVSTAGLGIDLNARDAAGNLIFNSPDFNSPLGQWLRLDMSLVATESSSWRFSPRSVSTASDWYFTGVLMEESPDLRPYFDGDTDPYRTKWTGAPQASISQLYSPGDPLRDYLRTIGEMFSEAELYSEDTEEYEGWSILLDVDRVPAQALPYLAQYVGERLPVGITEEAARQWIRDAPNQKRGTLQSIVDAGQRYLIGGKNVTVIERDGGPDKLTVVSYSDQTPDSSRVLTELRTVVPADISLTYVVSPGQIWSQVIATDPTWADTLAGSASWADLMAETPSGTYG